MKRIIVALMLESPKLYSVLRAASKNYASIGLDDDTVKWLRDILDDVKLIKLREMMSH